MLSARALLCIGLPVLLPPSAFSRTLLIKSSSSFWSGSPSVARLLVATTSNLPSAADTCISFCWLGLAASPFPSGSGNLYLVRVLS